MILGIGIDICLITRLTKVMERHGDAFLNRIFLPEERAYVEQLAPKMHCGAYAKRWAAKEACSKALGTGFSQGVRFCDIKVTSKSSGAPELTLFGGAAKVLEGLLPPGHEAQLFLTMSDDAPYAMANVLIQAVALR